MGNLLLILLLIFAGVGLMVVFGERFGGSPDTRRLQQLRRWLMPLVGLMLVLSLLNYYL
jgi:hypothetical protein